VTPVGIKDDVIKMKGFPTPDMQIVIVSPTAMATADFLLKSGDSDTSVPEFPSLVTPVVILVGCVEIVFYLPA